MTSHSLISAGTEKTKVDAAKMTFKNLNEANPFLRRASYRKGW